MAPSPFSWFLLPVIVAQSGQKERLPSGDGKMLLYNEKTVLVCGEAKAEYLLFK